MLKFFRWFRRWARGQLVGLSLGELAAASPRSPRVVPCPYYYPSLETQMPENQRPETEAAQGQSFDFGAGFSPPYAVAEQMLEGGADGGQGAHRWTDHLLFPGMNLGNGAWVYLGEGVVIKAGTKIDPLTDLGERRAIVEGFGFWGNDALKGAACVVRLLQPISDALDCPRQRVRLRINSVRKDQN